MQTEERLLVDALDRTYAALEARERNPRAQVVPDELDDPPDEDGGDDDDDPPDDDELELEDSQR